MRKRFVKFRKKLMTIFFQIVFISSIAVYFNDFMRVDLIQEFYAGDFMHSAGKLLKG